MDRQMPYDRSADGRDYVCALDGKKIPDGATVLATYDGAEKLVGVRAEGSDGHILHRCGEPVAGHDMTPAQRVEARADETYAAATGT